MTPYPSPAYHILISEWRSKPNRLTHLRQWPYGFRLPKDFHGLILWPKHCAQTLYTSRIRLMKCVQQKMPISKQHLHKLRKEPTQSTSGKCRNVLLMPIGGKRFVHSCYRTLSNGVYALRYGITPYNSQMQCNTNRNADQQHIHHLLSARSESQKNWSIKKERNLTKIAPKRSIYVRFYNAAWQIRHNPILQHDINWARRQIFCISQVQLFRRSCGGRGEGSGLYTYTIEWITH